MLGAASGGFLALAAGDAVRFVLLRALVGTLVTVFVDWIAPPMLATGT